MYHYRARSEVLQLRASPEEGEELSERRSLEKPAPGNRSARSGMPLRSASLKHFPLATGRGEPFFSLQGAAKRFLLPNDRWLPREAS